MLKTFWDGKTIDLLGQVSLETGGLEWSPSMALYRQEGKLTATLSQGKLLNNVEGVLKEKSIHYTVDLQVF